MKKYMILGSAVVFSLSMASSALAEQGWKNSPGEMFTISAGTVPGAQPIEFKPSSQVNMQGKSVTTKYAHHAYHEQAKGKKQGQDYGMTSDKSVIFWRKTLTSTEDVNSNETFAGTDWTKM